MGFLGILEDHKLPHVPGTVILNEEVANSQNLTANLKHGKGKNAHIVLAPQPSEDPNDPLNWSSTQKLTVVFIIGLGTILNAAVLSGILNTAIVEVALQFHVEIGAITLMTGYQFLVAGCSGPIVCACARKWGKRPQFIFSSLMCFIGTIIGSATTSYNGLLACRVIQGFAIAAYESIVVSMIGDLYFVHERGVYVAFFQFILSAVANLASIITGPIVTHLGWKYLFHILAAFVGAQLLLTIFFVPETAYNRDHRYDIDELAVQDLAELARTERSHLQHMQKGQTSEPQIIDHQEKADGDHLSTTLTRTSTNFRVPPRKSFFQQMSMFTQTYSDENLLQLVITPFAVCTNLAILWIVLVSSYIVCNYVAVLYVLAQIFIYPPYDMNPAGVGYLNVGPLVGGILSAVILGITLDPLLKWTTTKNNGVYEPEYRLLAMVGGLASGLGSCLYGYITHNGKSYYAASAMHGFILFGGCTTLVSTSAYAIDAYREMGNEIFIMSSVVKNFMFYGFSYFVNEWTAKVGTAEVFYVFGGISFALVLTTPVVFIFGKRYRSFWHRHNVLDKLNLRTHAEG